MRIAFTIPGTPTAKGRAKTRAFKMGDRIISQHYTPSKTQRAENSFLAQALPYKPESPLTGPLSLRISAVFPVPASYSRRRRAECLAGEEWPAKKPDYDNVAKLVTDALNGVFYRDDCQICACQVIKIYGDEPCVSVVLEHLINTESESE